MPYQIRAFLPRAALPALNADGAPLPDVDDFDTGCAEGRLEPPTGRVVPKGAAPVASWVHGTITGTRIAGWLPRRC